MLTATRPPAHRLLGATVVALTIGSTAAAGRYLPTSPQASPAPCTAVEYRQFDFFAGDWDTFDVATPSKLVARNHVTPMVGGCAIREVYEQTDGLRGESINTYDPSRRVWHQTWVTNRGQLLLLEGKLEGGRMVLTATEHDLAGATSLLRGIWWREGATVRERADRSRDGGKSWTMVFDIVFRPHWAG
jgi:hypothetical protein